MKLEVAARNARIRSRLPRLDSLVSTIHCVPPRRPALPQISGLEEKKRESIMVVANQTKSKLQLAEDALHRVQVGG